MPVALRTIMSALPSGLNVTNDKLTWIEPPSERERRARILR
jgi:hypothetical protein